MNWLFGKSSSHPTVPSTTPIQQQRLKQIKSLTTCNQNVVEVKRDVEYRVAFHCGTRTVTLNITLPLHFPNDKPTVHVSPSLLHPWVDAQMRVIGSPGLNMFYMHSDLGKVIQHIVKEFKKHPPQFNSPRDFKPPPVPSGFPSYQPPLVGNLISTTTTNEPTSSIERPPSYTSAHKVVTSRQSSGNTEVDIIMDKLDQLQKEELDRISNNPDMLLEYILEMESVVDLQKQRRQLVEENEEIAKQNMALEPVVEDLKGELKEKFEEYNDAYHMFQEKSRKQDELSQIYDIGNISTNLRIGVLQAEEESEKIAEDFLQGSINIDAFLTNYLDKRKLCHLRRAKEERIKSVLPY